MQHSSASSSSAGDTDTWSDFGDDAGVATLSLVRPVGSFESCGAALLHDRCVHAFDFARVVQSMQLDALATIKLVNWIRRGDAHGRSLDELHAVRAGDALFADDALLRPTIDGDGMLQHDFESDQVGLESTVRDLRAQLADTQAQLQHLRTTASLQFQHQHGLDDGTLQKRTRVSLRHDDSHYFHSYASNDIHGAMLRDTIRTDSYRHFLTSNPDLIKGKRVLDVGCGTGILSFFASRQGGASKVYAVDASTITKHTLEHVSANGFNADVVKVINKKIENVTVEDDLDGERVDVIVSEWMGYALLYEGFLPSVLDARNRLLKPIHEGGIMAPSQCSMLLSLWGNETWYRNKVAWWNDVYGYDFSSMNEETFVEAVVDEFNEDGLVATTPIHLHTIHTSALDVNELKRESCQAFQSSFQFTCQQPAMSNGMCRIDGFLLWFDTFFTTDNRQVDPVAFDQRQSWMKSPGEIAFSTGPKSLDTHWHQTLFVIRKPIITEPGTIVRGQFGFKTSDDNSRELDCTIQWTIESPTSNNGYVSSPFVQFWKVR